MTQQPGPADPAQDHQEHEADPWAINIPGHPRRSDSPEYVKSRQAMNDMAGLVSALIAQWTDSICDASIPLPTPAHKPLVLGENHPLARQAFVRQASPADTAQPPSRGRS